MNDASSDRLMKTEALKEVHRPMLRDPRRMVLACAGIASTGLGVLGAILPFLPTTVFIIIAAWCFAKSCPWLERALLRNRLFAPAMQIIDGERPFTTRMRVISLACMWLSGGLSTVLLLRTEGVHVAWPIVLVCVLLCGTVAILTYRRNPARARGI